VTVPGGHTATVIAHGPCGFGRCRHGDDCVTVHEDRYRTTTNYAADELIAR
jgi:hypothetical protein